MRADLNDSTRVNGMLVKLKAGTIMKNISKIVDISLPTSMDTSQEAINIVVDVLLLNRRQTRGNVENGHAEKFVSNRVHLLQLTDLNGFIRCE